MGLGNGWFIEIGVKLESRNTYYIDSFIVI